MRSTWGCDDKPWYSVGLASGHFNHVIELYEELVKLLERGENPGLATLMIRHGSAPAALGAKMLVRNDGTTLGSIGGGCVEAEVWQAAKTAAEKGEPAILSFRLDPKDGAQSGLICGGSVDILVEPTQSRHLALYRSLAGTLASNSRGVLGTKLPASSTSVPPAAGGSAAARVGPGDKFFLEWAKLAENRGPKAHRRVTVAQRSFMSYERRLDEVEAALEEELRGLPPSTMGSTITRW